MFSEKFRQELRHGKHTRWASDLSEEQLRCVLWIVGEFAGQSRPLMNFLDMHRGELSVANRGLVALEAMSRIVMLDERFDVNAWAQRLTRGRGYLEPEDLPQPVRLAVARAVPDMTWTLVTAVHDGYQFSGIDASKRSIGARVTNGGDVVVTTLVDEATIPQVVRDAVRHRVSTFDLHYVQALGPDCRTVHSYEFSISDSRGKSMKLVVSADGQRVAESTKTKVP